MGREIGHHQPPYLVAELSCNHSGSLSKAREMIAAAKLVGADAVKLQTYTPGELTTRENPELWALYEKAQTPRKWHAELFEYARKIGITCFSSAFSMDGFRFLETFAVPAHKIASPEIHNSELVKWAIKSGKPVIISTGMATEVQIAELAAENTIFLHCVAQYPSRIEDANLRAIETIQKYAPAGLSDHTPGYETAIAATALGAVMIEKHFKLDDDCIDAAYSLHAADFAKMAVAVRAVWKGLGVGKIVPTGKARQK